MIEARVEQRGSGTLVDIEKIRDILATNGVGVISKMDPTDETLPEVTRDTNSSVSIHNEVVVSKNQFVKNCRKENPTIIFGPGINDVTEAHF